MYCIPLSPTTRTLTLKSDDSLRKIIAILKVSRKLQKIKKSCILTRLVHNHHVVFAHAHFKQVKMNLSEVYFRQVVKNGTFYNPASKRYGPLAVVVCDRCRKKPLLACISGANGVDVCLLCANALVEESSRDAYPENLVGKTAEYTRANFPHARVHRRDSGLTMEFIHDRVNAEENEAGIITRVWFG